MYRQTWETYEEKDISEVSRGDRTVAITWQSGFTTINLLDGEKRPVSVCILEDLKKGHSGILYLGVNSQTARFIGEQVEKTRSIYYRDTPAQERFEGLVKRINAEVLKPGKD